MAKTRVTRRKPTTDGASAPTAPWWLSGNDHECPHCGGGYAFEAAVRCVECDGEICWFCVTWSERRGRCPECAGSAGTD